MDTSVFKGLLPFQHLHSFMVTAGLAVGIWLFFYLESQLDELKRSSASVQDRYEFIQQSVLTVVPHPVMYRTPVLELPKAPPKRQLTSLDQYDRKEILEYLRRAAIYAQTRARANGEKDERWEQVSNGLDSITQQTDELREELLGMWTLADSRERHALWQNYVVLACILVVAIGCIEWCKAQIRTNAIQVAELQLKQKALA